MREIALLQHDLTKRFEQKPMSKKDLYDALWDIRTSLYIPYDDPLCHFAGHTQDFISLETRKFSNKKYCGIINKAMAPDKSYVVINSENLKEVMRFSFLHELIHWFFHSPRLKHHNIMGGNKFSFEDYQANEGAAEFLMPYKVFVTCVSTIMLEKDLSLEDIMNAKNQMAKFFNVTTAMIHFRIESLKYEIHQYVNGTDLKDIRMLSRKQQVAQGIKVTSLNDMEWFVGHNIPYDLHYKPAV